MVSLPLQQGASREASFSEYTAASKRLGEVTDDDPYTLYSQRNSPVFDIISKLLGDLPTVRSLLLLFFFEST
jgi:hypothetical protein